MISRRLHFSQIQAFSVLYSVGISLRLSEKETVYHRMERNMVVPFLFARSLERTIYDSTTFAFAFDRVLYGFLTAPTFFKQIGNLLLDAFTRTMQTNEDLKSSNSGSAESLKTFSKTGKQDVRW